MSASRRADITLVIQRSPAVRVVALFLLVLAAPAGAATSPLMAAHGVAKSATTDSSLPTNPKRWTCASSRKRATKTEKRNWCQSHPDRGEPLPAALRSPPPLEQLVLKNAYDLGMQEFAETQRYVDLGWQRDATWRFTGPYVGEIGDGENYGTHLAIRIAYSPEVIEWLCNGQQGELPDGAAIVKEMAEITPALDVELDDEGCMVIPGDPTPTVWTIMVKRGDQSWDGWYWLFLHQGAPPLVLGLPGISERLEDFYADGYPPTAPNPEWIPSGGPGGSGGSAMNSFGGFCIQCHGVAKAEATFSSLDNLVGKSLRYKQYDATTVETAGGPPPPVDTGLTTALTDASPDFLDFFDQLDEVSFTRAWETSLPGQTYDHVVVPPEGPPPFVTSDQCWTCHGSHNLLALQSNMVLTVDDDELDLSPLGEWRASPMDMAGRDPIFYAQLQGETNYFPDLRTCIETTCFHCHAPMGERQLAIDTPSEADPACQQFFGIAPPEGVPFGKPFERDMVMQWPESPDGRYQKYGALARDGVSCTVCHHVDDAELGEEQTFTGNFLTGPADEVYGPYQKVTTVHMERALGITPKHGKQVKDGDLCGSCHNVLLPVFTNQGVLTGYSYEQATHLEWTNSDYAPGRKRAATCQECHMPRDWDGTELVFRIANAESNLFPQTTDRLPDRRIKFRERHDYRRHALHGVNLFLNQIAQQFPLLLGIGQQATNPIARINLVTGANSMITMAESQTASVAIGTLETTADGLRVVATVTNDAGHKLPSGVGFRRMFLELLVQGADGETLWASGRTNAVGAIVDGTSDTVLPSEEPLAHPEAPVQPHHMVITRQDQVQIYQEVYRDSAGQLTTSFLRRVTAVKDNRIPPHGYDPARFLESESPYIAALGQPVGDVARDPYYTDPSLTGADVIEYAIALDAASRARAATVTLTLYSQSIPPFYLQDRFAAASVGAAAMDQIERLYYVGSHLNVDGQTDADGRAVLSDWKLYVASTEATVD